MLLTEAREIVRKSALWAKDSYDADQVDRAILFAGDYFMRRTKAVTTKATLALTGDDYDYDLTAAVVGTGTASDFHPGLFRDARIGNAWLTPIDFPAMVRKHDASSTTGTPLYIAFETAALAWLYPIPSSALTLTFRYYAPFTSFTPGTAAVVTLNVPDRWLRDLLWWGASTALVYGEGKGNPYAMEGWQRFEKWIGEVRGEVNLNRGARVKRESAFED